MSSFETKRIRLGAHVAVLRAEVSPAGVGRCEVAWEPSAPGRLSASEWDRLKRAKARWLAKLAGIYGVQPVEVAR